MINLKQHFAGSVVGQFAITSRSISDLVKHAAGVSEQTGTKINDIVSRRLRDSLCQPGKIFVDVGAHIGSVIGGVRLSSRPSKIIAIEAMPEKAASLRRRFPDADIIECAVGEHSGEVEFTIDKAASGYSSLDPAVRDRTSAFEIITVKMQRLDDILPHSGVDVMKVDIEGAELGALRGGEAMIAACRPVIVFESGVHDMTGYTKPALFNWFSDRDYEVVSPVRVAHTAPPMTLDTYLYAHEYPRLSTDFFAIPREKREAFRDRARAILRV